MSDFKAKRNSVLLDIEAAREGLGLSEEDKLAQDILDLPPSVQRLIAFPLLYAQPPFPREVLEKAVELAKAIPSCPSKSIHAWRRRFAYGLKAEAEIFVEWFDFLPDRKREKLESLLQNIKAEREHISARMRRCQECDNFFYANDLRKLYCSEKCRNAWNNKNRGE